MEIIFSITFLKSKCNWVSAIQQSKDGVILPLLLFTTIFNVVAPMVSGKIMALS